MKKANSEFQIGEPGTTNFISLNFYRGNNNKFGLCGEVNGGGSIYVSNNTEITNLISVMPTQTNFSTPIQTTQLITVNNGKTSFITTGNTAYCHFNTDADTGFHFIKNVYVQGNIYAGTWYSDLVLTEKNYINYPHKYLKYPAQLSSDTEIDSFNAANTFQVATWNSTSSPGVTNGMIISTGWTSTSYGAQIAIDDDPTYYMALRQKGTSGWNAWKRIPMGDGTGASGTWPISITGNSTYAPGASKLYSTDSSYSYTSGNPYYGYLTYNSPYWDFKVSPASPDDVRVSAAYTDAEGYSITGYLKNYQQYVDLSSYSTSTWYPVCIYIPKGGMHKITCACQLDTNVPSWSNHTQGFTRVIEMLVTSSGWGTTNAASICLYDYSAFGGDQAVGYSQFTNSSSACFWCRGGGLYRIITDFKESPRIYTSSTTVSSQTIAPTTSYPGMSFTKSTIYANLTGDTVKGAVWNDYAEYRNTVNAKPGEVIIENGDGTLHKSFKRLEPGANVITDTFGFSIGETDQTKTPIAVAGRVLAYPYEDRYSYKPGAAVCSAPDGKISQMTREEMINYPDCIIGYVSEIPEYETWGTGNVNVDGRIWIKIK